MSAQVSDDPLVRVDITRTKDQEFTAFVQDAGPYLYKTALFLSGDPHRAEELVQATFERSYRSWHKARAGEPRAYARRILINLRIDGWRRSRHEVVAEAVPPGSVVGPADGVAVLRLTPRAASSGQQEVRLHHAIARAPNGRSLRDRMVEADLHASGLLSRSVSGP